MRSGWNARNPRATTSIRRPVPRVFIHHTYTPSCSDLASCARRIRSIQNYHMDNKGNDILITIWFAQNSSSNREQDVSRYWARTTVMQAYVCTDRNPLFTALHGMQTRSSDENSLSQYVCLSDKRVLCDKTEEKSVQIFISYERSFSLVFWEKEWLVGGRPFYLKSLILVDIRS